MKENEPLQLYVLLAYSPDHHYNHRHFRPRKPGIQNNALCTINILDGFKASIILTPEFSNTKGLPGFHAGFSDQGRTLLWVLLLVILTAEAAAVDWYFRNPACWHFRKKRLSLEKIGLFYVQLRVCDLYQQWNCGFQKVDKTLGNKLSPANYMQTRKKKK